MANDTTPNFLYHNEGNGVFKETALTAGVSVAADGRPRAGMGTDFGDYDNDGRLDLFVTNHELETHTLFRNLGRGLFAETTTESGVGVETLPYVGFGAQFFDYDNDGDLDLGVVNGHVMNDSGHFRPGSKEAQRKLLFRNDGGGRFKEVGRTSGSGFVPEAVGRTLVAGDVDNDGALDLLVTNNGGPAELLRNGGGTGNNAVLLALVGTKSNRGAIGARVRLTAGGSTQVQGDQGRIELPRRERSARAFRPGPGTPDQPGRDPLAVGRNRDDSERTGQCRRDDHRRQGRDGTDSVSEVVQAFRPARSRRG